VKFRPIVDSAPDQQNTLRKTAEMDTCLTKSDMILPAACEANRDHLPRPCELLVWYKFWFLVIRCALCKRGAVHKPRL